MISVWQTPHPREQGNYFISFIILSESLEDPSFHLGNGIHIVNVILEYFYLGLLIMCYILSLGNRPQGSKWTYSICIVLFGLCNVITLWCAGYTVYLAVPHTLDGWKDFPKYV